MKEHAELCQGMVKIVLYALLAFFLLPGIGLLFSGHMEGNNDRAFMTGMTQRIAQDNTMTAAEKEQATHFVLTHPPSASRQ